MKRTVGRSMKIFKGQWPKNMDFYKRRIMVARALTAVYIKNWRFQSIIMCLFRKRWEVEIEEAKAAGETFNKKAIQERQVKKIQKKRSKFYKKHGYKPFHLYYQEA